MTKFWRTSATKNGKLVILYLATTDEAIAADLAAGSSSSLIDLARSSTRPQKQSPQDDHFDLAAGAFSYYISRHCVSQACNTILAVDMIPSGLQYCDFGGNPSFAIRLYEQPGA